MNFYCVCSTQSAIFLLIAVGTDEDTCVTFLIYYLQALSFSNMGKLFPVLGFVHAGPSDEHSLLVERLRVPGSSLYTKDYKDEM